MVFHYTNFIMETNSWWLKRVRPVWMGGAAIYFYYMFQRYYFFGKNSARWQAWTDDEEGQRRAALNKRNWGYDAIYRPTLARSRKRQMMEALGENYKFASPFPERFMMENRTLEQIYEEDDNYE